MSARRETADVIEDAEWLDSSGVGATDAASRLDFPTPTALEKWLGRHDRYDLWLRFKSRDPEGVHSKEQRREAATVTTIDPIAARLARAKKSDKASIRRRAEKIETLLDDLGQILDAHVEESQAKAKARAEVLRLERQLAEAKAALRGTRVKAATTTSATPAAEIRAWAAENGIACPAVGRVPSSVVEQYEAQQVSA